MTADITDNLAFELFKLLDEDAGPTPDLHHRKHQAAMRRAREILTYKPDTASEVEETLNTWAMHLTRKGQAE